MPSINTAYQWAIKKCNESNIGYSQNYRNQQTVGGITYYDCSSFINYALLAGGWTTPGYAPTNNAFTTFTMGAELERLGFKHYTTGSNFVWKPGDIGVNTETHTEMCYKGGTGTAQFMGAHTSDAPLADQVSIGSYTRTFDNCYRYGNGAGDYKWHAKATGAYDRTSTEAIENAYCMADVLVGSLGWTNNALAGLLGNMSAESGYNPFRWEGDNVQSTGGSPWSGIGYGLVQFTPAGKYINSSAAKGYKGYGPNFSNQSGKATDGEAQLRFIDSTADYYPTSSYPESFSEFKKSTKDAGYLARAWLYNYERPLDPSATAAARAENASYWYSVLDGYIPGGGGGGGSSASWRFGAVRDVIRRLILHA